MPDEYGNLTPEELAMHNGNKTTGIFAKAGSTFKKVASSVKNKVTDTASSVKTTVGNARNAVASGVTQAKESIAEAGAAVSAAGAQVVGHVSEAADTVTEGAKNFANSAVDAVTGAYDATTQAVSDFAGDAKDFTTNLAHTVGDAAEAGFDYVKDTASDLASDVKDFTTDVANTVGDAAEAGFDYVKDTATDVANAVDDAYDVVQDSVSTAVDDVKDSAAELGNSIATAADSDGDGKKEVALELPEFIEDSKVAGWLGEIAERAINNNPFFQLVGYEIDIETSISPEAVELAEEIALDVAQVGLGVLGFVPGFGEVADLASAVISVKQGDYLGAALDAASAIPFAGWASGAASIIKHGDDIADAFKAIKKLSNAVDAVDTAVDTAKVVENAEDVAKSVDNAVDAGKDISKITDSAIVNIDEGFDSFRQLKKHMGDPGPGNHWHHIVEQSQIKKAGFDPKLIHNPKNIVAVDGAKIHPKITGAFGTKVENTGKRMRDWISNKSFDEQFEYGKEVMEKIIKEMK